MNSMKLAVHIKNNKSGKERIEFHKYEIKMYGKTVKGASKEFGKIFNNNNSKLST